ncbi:MAG TPA: glucans biosynthesis glucosyltransferase MdoH [Phenylobacterium sp.]|jgi:membrane glycosyltransferase|nr:glucans biosynthesis glucosyltransferase MdoH [Phenylobacterium sp.]
MTTLVSRLERPILGPEVVAPPAPWLPPEAPLAMPRQSIDEPGTADLAEAIPATSPPGVVRRRVAVFGGALFLTILIAIGPYVLYARAGFNGLETAGLGVFIVLAGAIATWFCTAAAGHVVLANGREQDDLDFSPHPPLPTQRTALLMPLYNENAGAAFARLAALDASLARLGASDAFDIFVLSDSTREDCAAAEVAAYGAHRLVSHSRLYMRRRPQNTERKAGNIAEWVRRFGGAYAFMVVLDADSTMAGETLLRLVDAMERRPGVGLIQTAPTITGATTLIARMSQFGVRMYGRVAAAGLAWWAGSEASYWGHNAIVRTRAFAASCGLPILEGVKPFGGHVLSHDVIEAALLRRAGWAVHVTAALDGSCEETPPTLLDFIQRDHRWCQGNLQHLRLIGAKGLHPLSRAQLGMGCMAYLASPLWFAGLAIGLALQLEHPVDWTSFWYFLNPRFTPFMLTSVLSGVLLIGPKILGCVLVLSRPGERRAFGGAAAVLKGMGTEILLSAALAPVLMVANTKAVLQTLQGRDIGWRPQQRDAVGVAWRDAFRAMSWQMTAGLGFVAALCFRPDLSICFAPIVLPLLLAAPLAVFTSRRSAMADLLRTPDDLGVSAMPVVFRTNPRPVPAGHSQDAISILS